MEVRDELLEEIGGKPESMVPRKLTERVSKTVSSAAQKLPKRKSRKHVGSRDTEVWLSEVGSHSLSGWVEAGVG